MAYTLKEIQSNKKFVVFIENKRQYQALEKTGLFNVAGFYGAYCYDLVAGQYSSGSTKTNSGAFNHKTIIQFNEIDFLSEDSVLSAEDYLLKSIGCPFKEGDYLSGNLQEEFVKRMKIHVEDNAVYLCQNFRDGANCDNKQGFKYSYCIYEEDDDDLSWEELLERYKVEDLKLIDPPKDSITPLPEYFFVKHDEDIINKLIELYPDSQVENQYESYKDSVDLPYVGVSADYPEFEVNDYNFFDTEDNCEQLTKEEFWSFFKQENKPSDINVPSYIISQDCIIPEVQLTSFSKITDKKTKQITKLFKF